MICLSDDSFEMNEENREKKSFFHECENNFEDINKALFDNFDWAKQVEEKNGSLFEENPQQYYSLNIKPKIQQETLFLIEKNYNKITKPTTLSNQIKNVEDKQTKNSIHFKIEEKMSNYPKKLLPKKRGRKANNPENDQKQVHDKYSPDNIMRKIKTNLMDYIVNELNESLEDKTHKFYKVSSSISENLKKDFNLELMERTISDIFIKTKLSNKYRKNKNNSFNKDLIDKIYKEKVEIKTINILEKKYIEIINEIKENGLKDFLNKIKAKVIFNENEKVDEYINSLEEIFNDYEKWFKSKKGRTTGKNKSE